MASAKNPPQPTRLGEVLRKQEHGRRKYDSPRINQEQPTAIKFKHVIKKLPSCKIQTPRRPNQSQEVQKEQHTRNYATSNLHVGQISPEKFKRISSRKTNNKIERDQKAAGSIFSEGAD
jgi:hypothetical protein